VLNSKQMQLEKVHPHDNVADMLTKLMTREKPSVYLPTRWHDGRKAVRPSMRMGVGFFGLSLHMEDDFEPNKSAQMQLTRPVLVHR
jgi:hypothetical protein